MTSTIEFPTTIVVNATEKTPIRVLHVDDYPSILRVSKKILEMKDNFEVTSACSVDEALKKMETQSFDAIVCDYEMPGKTGLDFLAELRDGGHSIPFILFSGKGREEVAMKALNLGADQYIDKNGDPETVYCELSHSIRVAVGERKPSERYLLPLCEESKP